MRRLWIGALVTLLAAACAGSPTPASAPSRSSHGAHVNPANVKRIGRELPPGYEATSAAGMFAPAATWGLGSGATADPPQCANLADPGTGRGAAARGVSGSGAGGIVYAVVVTVRPGPVARGRDLVAACGRWTMIAGHTRASVRLIDSPRIDGAETLGIVSDTTTSVEGRSQTDSRAYTFAAYLGDCYAFTTLITDPGATHPPLPPQFAADLLVKTVSAVRG